LTDFWGAGEFYNWGLTLNGICCSPRTRSSAPFPNSSPGVEGIFAKFVVKYPGVFGCHPKGDSRAGFFPLSSW
jgi:hypothetical protein